MPLLRVRKVADKEGATRIVANHPTSGRTMLVNPTSGREEAWPLKGVQVEGDLPEECTVGTTFVQRAVSEGWATLVNERAVFRPSGPPHDKWGGQFVPHAFVHCDAIVFHFLDGDAYYEVTHQPDKYVASKRDYKGEQIDTYPDFSLDDEPVTDEHYAAGLTRVDHFYGLRLRNVNGV